MAPKIVRGTSWPKNVRKTVTFTGGAGLGAVGTVALFTVTGEVFVDAIVPFCTVDLVEGGATVTMSLGVVGNVAAMIAVSEPEDMDAGETWMVQAPADLGAKVLQPLVNRVVVSANIQLDILNDTVDSGTLEFTCLWTPLSPDGLVVPA